MFGLVPSDLPQGLNRDDVPSGDHRPEPTACRTPHLCLLRRVVRGCIMHVHVDADTGLSQRRAIPYDDGPGFRDLAESAGLTFPADNPSKRIDYVWGIGVTGSNAHTVNAPNASDHRGLVVNVRRQGNP